jgi:hypothetical protein
MTRQPIRNNDAGACSRGPEHSVVPGTCTWYARGARKLPAGTVIFVANRGITMGQIPLRYIVFCRVHGRVGFPTAPIRHDTITIL